MKTINLPFIIGKDYENWEFDLEVLDIERIKGYDSYLYLKKIILFERNADYVELIFLFDILEIVFIKFSFESQEKLLEFKEKLTSKSYTIIIIQELGLNLKLLYGNLDEKAHF